MFAKRQRLKFGSRFQRKIETVPQKDESSCTPSSLFVLTYPRLPLLSCEEAARPGSLAGIVAEPRLKLAEKEGQTFAAVAMARDAVERG